MNRTTIIVVVVVALFLGLGAYLVFGHQPRPVQARTYELHVTDKTMSPSHLQAYQGDTLTITVFTDKDEEIHLHGYDKHFFASPEHPATQKFVADKTGNFEIEIEAISYQVGELEVDPR